MSAAERLALAWQHYQAGELTAAEQVCRDLLRGEPANAQALGMLGAVCLAANRCGEAVEHLRQAATLLPNSWAAHANLGIALAGVGKPADAEECFRYALRIEPNNADIHF